VSALVASLRSGDGRNVSVHLLKVNLLIIVAAFAAAYTLVAGHTSLAIGIAFLPLLVWESTRLTGALVLLGASIPEFANIAGGATSTNAALSDLLLVFIGGSVLLRAAVVGSAPALHALRPVALPVIQYGVFMSLLYLVHPAGRELLQTGQRAELLVLPLIVGAFAALTDRYLQLLKGYVLATSVLAAVWPLDHLSLQKNPVGQFIGNAILLLIAVPRLRALLPCLLVLVPGLFLTGSRGALAATLVGLAVVALMHDSRGRLFLTRVVPILIAAVAAFALVPASVSQRLTTTSSGALQTTAQYSIHIHQQYAHDAHVLIAAHPWTGIGVGNYYAGDPNLGTQTTDPHEVVLLQEAEGGYGFAASFVLLLAATSFVLYRLRRVDVAPAAAAVLIATAAHGMVDVYWVRGTPVLGWLLTGMVCGAAWRSLKRVQS
jgi:O-Antigen ligase